MFRRTSSAERVLGERLAKTTGSYKGEDRCLDGVGGKLVTKIGVQEKGGVI